MAELKIEIPEDLEEKMSELHEIDWSRAINSFVRQKVSEWIRLRSIVSKSKLTEKDALEIGRKVNESMAKRYKDIISLK